MSDQRERLAKWLEHNGYCEQLRWLHSIEQEQAAPLSYDDICYLSRSFNDMIHRPDVYRRINEWLKERIRERSPNPTS